MDLKLRENKDARSQRCGYCHEPLEVRCACPFCGAALHADCWTELRSCPSLGCGFEVERSEIFRRRWGIGEGPPPDPAPSSPQDAWLARAVKVEDVTAGRPRMKPANAPSPAPKLIALAVLCLCLPLAFIDWALSVALLSIGLVIAEVCRLIKEDEASPWSS